MEIEELRSNLSALCEQGGFSFCHQLLPDFCVSLHLLKDHIAATIDARMGIPLRIVGQLWHFEEEKPGPRAIKLRVFSQQLIDFLHELHFIHCKFVSAFLVFSDLVGVGTIEASDDILSI